MINLRRLRPPFRDRSRATLRVEKQYSSGSKDREIKREREESEMGERKIGSGGKEEQKWKNRLGGEERRGKEREAKGGGRRGWRKNRVAAVDVRFPSVIGAAEI